MSVEGLSDKVEMVELHQDRLRKDFLPLVIRQIRPGVIVSAMEHPNALTGNTVFFTMEAIPKHSPRLFKRRTNIQNQSI